jgi:hypothetical protein
VQADPGRRRPSGNDAVEARPIEGLLEVVDLKKHHGTCCQRSREFPVVIADKLPRWVGSHSVRVALPGWVPTPEP